MTAGQFLDRAINAALIKAATAANRLMELSAPMRTRPTPMADVLAQAEEATEVWEPAPVPEWPSLAEWEQELRDAFFNHKSCDVSATLSPRQGVEEVAPPSGAGAAASAGLAAAGTGGHPDRPTSELISDAVTRLQANAYLWPQSDPLAHELIAELRDRAAAFEAYGD